MVDGGISVPFDVTTGVLQGDVLAPFLFIILVDCLLRVDRIPNTDIYNLTETAPLVEKARTRQLKFVRHILRLPDDEPIRVCIQNSPTYSYNMAAMRLSLLVLHVVVGFVDSSTAQPQIPYDYCPVGWTLGDTGNWTGNCYKYIKERVNGDEAEQKCIEEGGHLVSLNSQSEEDWVFAHWQSEGLGPSGPTHVSPSNALWIGAIKVSGTWIWTDGTLPNPPQTDWGYCVSSYGYRYYQPDNDGNCAHLWTANCTPRPSWNDLYCNTYQTTYYMCETPSVCCLPWHSTAQPQIPYDYCPVGWTLGDTGNCYKYIKERVNGDEAEQKCIEEGGHLVSLNSQGEEDWVFKHWQSQGLGPSGPSNSYVSPSNALWIGAIKVSGTWIWTDGTLPNPPQTDWGYCVLSYGYRYYQPDNTGNCAHLWTANCTPRPSWNDLYCNNYQTTYYMCERPSVECCLPWRPSECKRLTVLPV
ncbi:C-type mannose receptor 2-like [Amphiura filiformis]|uniref:C-type mannose receptor 2-like n=1 Tax=Amphiura filiformis TaxID=82378 RepID=UPI003B20EC0B